VQGKYTNFLGMDFVGIKPGSFMMGDLQGPNQDDNLQRLIREDEAPVHKVTITQLFYMAAAPVTNKQYEVFAPEHRRYRGRNGFSFNDDDAVVFVSWYDAAAFCRWLSHKEGRPYRLPTEAEWEYAARAGTATAYFTGGQLPPEFKRKDLAIKQAAPNPWGLYDIHGLVEEWCYDWYGPYSEDEKADPLGYDHGVFKVLRGGSHSTDDEYLRVSNRMAQIPEARNWLMGFRVVIGELPSDGYVYRWDHQERRKIFAIGNRCLKTVSEREAQARAQAAERDLKLAAAPYFSEPRTYVKLSYECPFGYHNHQPALTELPNGDLLAAWYTTETEEGRELRYAASRFDSQRRQWEPASVFWLIPDRNPHGCDLFWDPENNVIYHFFGVAAAENKGLTIAVAVRQSFDGGSTWAPPRLISPDFSHRGQVISSTIKTSDGRILVFCDDLKYHGTAVYVSGDGINWTCPAAEQEEPQEERQFAEGKTGPLIAGIHASVVELDDGTLLAAGRGRDINGSMPFSLSADGGRTWTYRASELPPVSGGQRHAMIRLQEGPILLIGFTDRRDLPREEMKGVSGFDANGRLTQITGLYAALSFDQGKTWPIKRVLSDGSGRRVESTDPNQYVECAKDKNGNRIFTMDPTSGEAMGYCAAVQARNGMIHVISSRQHYMFNYQWLIEHHWG